MNVSSLFRVVGVGVALVLVATGCSDHRTTSTPPAISRVAAMPSAAAPAARPGIRLSGAMPQSELDKIYQGTPSSAVFDPRRTTTASIPKFTDDPRIVALPGWDVNVTREWRHIVIHHSASATGSAAAFDKAHKDRGWEGLGYHFVIGNGTGSGDGAVEVGFRWRQQEDGAHAGNSEYNKHGIGICLVGDFENGAQPSAAQWASLRQLVRFLQVKTGVPTSEIIGHCNVPDKKTLCPGHIDLAAFRESLGGGAIGVPIYQTPVVRAASPSKPVRLARSPNASGAAMP